MTDDEHGREEADLSVELRRLRRAAIFFAICVVIVVVLGAVGLYH